MPFCALIGANHSHQLPGNRHGHASSFQDYVARHGTDQGVDLLAEEMSKEALRRWKVEKSSVQAAAEAIHVRHLLCDPDSQQRQTLGIPSYEELKKSRNIMEPTEEEARLLEDDERIYWPKRERFWLDQVQKVSHKRMLFVAGPDHVESFATLLSGAGYQLLVICRRWEA